MEKIISTKVIFQSPIFTVYHHEIEMPEKGVKSFRDCVTHRGGAGVFAVTNDNEVLLVKQYRIATGETLLEIPAGKLELNETPAEAIRREIEEETGYQAESFVDFGFFYPTPGYSSEKTFLFYASNLKPGKLKLDFDEEIALVKLPLNELAKLIVSNTITDGKTIIAYYKYLSYIKNQA